MKYRCIPCDHQFDVHEGSKPRCPKCMGVHDLEKIDFTSESKAGKSKKTNSWLAPSIVLLLLVGAGVAYKLTGDDENTETAQIDSSDLKSLMQQLGIEASEVVLPFEITPSVKALAKKLSGGKDNEEALQEMLEGLGAMKKTGEMVPFHQREPIITKPLTAPQAAEQLMNEKTTPWNATSYELAALLLAMSRSLDIDAHMAQIYEFEGEKKPADLYGKLGRYGVVFGKDSAENKPPLYDPWAQRFGKSAKGDYSVMPDDEATAPFYAISSLGLLITKKTAPALRMNDLAIKLGPKCSLYRISRGLIFASSGAPSEAIAEFEKALKQRNDALNQTNLAEIMIMSDPSGARAEVAVQSALSKSPDYFRAHVVLAMLHMIRQNFDDAETELAIADRLEPNSPLVMLTWAQLFAYQRRGEEAIAKAKEAIRLSDESLSSLMAMAGIYKTTARFDEMRKTLDIIFKKYSDYGITEELGMLFGYSPDEDTEQDSPQKHDAGTGDYNLQLKNEGTGFGGNLKLSDDGWQSSQKMNMGSDLKLNMNSN